MSSQTIVLGVLWGVILGLFYFGGLWFTVQWLPGSRRPKLLLALSFIARTTAVMLSFWLVLQRDPMLFGVTLLFFFGLRFIITGLLGGPRRRDVHAN